MLLFDIVALEHDLTLTLTEVKTMFQVRLEIESSVYV